ncbi:MAG: HAMP domain-containing protein [Rhodothermales bacterium]|nr:HAMP domain-containing protein [Rhodothermales bacterium]
MSSASGTSRSWTPVAVAALLVLAVLTAGLREFDQRRIEDRAAELASGRADAVAEAIRADLGMRFEELVKWARELAVDPAIREGIRMVEDAGDASGLVGRMAEVQSDRLISAEVYDQAPSLLAWSGFAMPMDRVPSDPGFLDDELTGIATDGGKRTALVAWVPVRDGAEVIGAVRTMRLVESRMPVRNEYLSDYTWDALWSRDSGLDVRFHLGAEDVPEAEAFELVDAEGQPIGSVVVEPPAPNELTERRAARFGDIMALWVVLALAVILRHLIGGVRRNPATAEHPGRGLMRAGLVVAAIVTTRFILLGMNVPARWQPGRSPFSPLFDPQHLASTYGFGLMASIGELIVTALLFALCVRVLFLCTPSVRSIVESRRRGPSFDSIGGSGSDGDERHSSPPSSAPVPTARLLGFFGVHALVVALGTSLVFGFAFHAVLDSTLDTFARVGLLPDRLVLVVLASLLVLLVSVVLALARGVWVLAAAFRVDPATIVGRRAIVIGASAVTAIVLTAYGLFVPPPIAAPPAILLIAAVLVFGVATLPFIRHESENERITLRTLVPAVIVSGLLLYPMLNAARDESSRVRMREAAIAFQEELDARIMFAVGQVLERASSPSFSESIGDLISSGASRSAGDSLATDLTRGTMVTSLAGRDATVAVHRPNGTVLGVSSNRIGAPSTSLDRADTSVDFPLLASMYAESPRPGPMIEKMTDPRRESRFRYAGYMPVATDAVVTVLVETRSTGSAAVTPFPRVLVPGGYYGREYSDLSLAEFENGVLVRDRGTAFGRTLLDREARIRLQDRDEVWMREQVRDRTYMTLYRWGESDDMAPDTGGVNSGQATRGGAVGARRADGEIRESVVAVRRRAVGIFDHLYYLLRVLAAGLAVAGVVYVWSLATTAARGTLRNRRGRFRDRVLNAFFLVGTVTVVATGFVGMRVVTGETDRAIEHWLRQHLDRVEETLQIEAAPDEMTYRVLERISVDSLAARVGLDLNIYRRVDLERTSRPELVRDRLIDQRLPIQAYDALFVDGFSFVTVSQYLGSFRYTAGYRAFTDEAGRARYVVSIPTLPEQERIEEERARTLAYLFGALLLLVLVVLLTAGVLANALTRPIARLRAGLQAVAAGHFERIGPMRTSDEFSELVDTFNTMQEQIEESRDLVAQQERQLAWREMARQVAHEIKNPLTPMRLSIQHLRSAFERLEDESDRIGFIDKFNRTTSTLLEQIETLARIANEFSSFGRMPTHIREELDLNAVVREAASLMQAEEGVDLRLDVDDRPLAALGDREALRRVLVNFIKNAVQAVPDDRRAVVTIRTGKSRLSGGQPAAECRVEDNGTGIPEQLADKVFEPSFSTKTSGTGLGLAISKKTIEHLEGEIGFETSPGEGTTFWLRIPVPESR